MFSLHPHARRLSLAAGVAVLLSGMVAGQAIDLQPGHAADADVFASVHQTLGDAADRTLAAALADRPWMDTAQAGKTDASASTTRETVRVKRLRAAIERVRRLQPTIEPILREEGLPVELTAVVLAESGGRPEALSPKGARGIWQLMPETARRYGLAVDAAHDERLDVPRSTRAAARYLRSLHQRFGDWELAFAAYNAGEQAVSRAVDRMAQRNFSGIAQALPQETRSYVPAVLAAMDRLPGRHFSTPTRVIYASAEPGD